MSPSLHHIPEVPAPQAAVKMSIRTTYKKNPLVIFKVWSLFLAIGQTDRKTC